MQTGLSVLYNWVPNDWLFTSVVSLGLGVVVLILPMILGTIQHLMDKSLIHISDNIYEYYCVFFYLQSDVPKFLYSKIMVFMFSFSILVFMTFYTGTLTEVFFSYKNFDGYSTKEDLIGTKVGTYEFHSNIVLAAGSNFP